MSPPLTRRFPVVSGCCSRVSNIWINRVPILAETTDFRGTSGVISFDETDGRARAEGRGVQRTHRVWCIQRMHSARAMEGKAGHTLEHATKNTGRLSVCHYPLMRTSATVRFTSASASAMYVSNVWCARWRPRSSAGAVARSTPTSATTRTPPAPAPASSLESASGPMAVILRTSTLRVTFISRYDGVPGLPPPAKRTGKVIWENAGGGRRRGETVGAGE